MSGYDFRKGQHYGQRPCVPHSKAEHMAAPTNAANVKKALANSAPSTHGTKRTSHSALHMSAFDPKQTSAVSAAVRNRRLAYRRPNYEPNG